MKNRSDLAWARKRGGKLTRLEIARLALTVGALRLERLIGRRRRKMISAVEQPDAISSLPDSTLVKAALEECRASCSAAIISHSCRTFAWGALLGAGQQLGFDREALAVAALLHDIELGHTESRAAVSCTCFACAGAVRAERFALDHGCFADRAALIGDAIAMHLDPVVPLSCGVEAHLLQAGAALDVIGTGLSLLPKHWQAGILSRYPRTGFKTEVADALAREARFERKTRAGFLMSVGFGDMIAAAPFLEAPAYRESDLNRSGHPLTQ
jgi:hypothetical protein